MRDSIDCTNDEKKFCEHSLHILTQIRKTIGGVHVKRPEIDHLVTLTNEPCSSRFILVLGDRGTGKSSLVKTFCLEHLPDNTNLFYLRAEDLDESNLMTVSSFSDDQIQGLCNQVEVLQEFSSNPDLMSLRQI